MSVKISTSEWKGKVNLWIESSAPYTKEEQQFLTTSGLRASKNPQKWFCEYDAATEAVLKTHFAVPEGESTYDDTDSQEKPPKTTAHTETTRTPASTTLIPCRYPLTDAQWALEQAIQFERGRTDSIDINRVFAHADQILAWVKTHHKEG